MCKKYNFVQLHLHTSFSLLDGVTDYKKVIARAKELGHPAIAITDHGNPAGLFDFNRECKKQGIKPILGLEFYICNDLNSRIPNKNRAIDDRDYHQSVFIKNKIGYYNFNYLTYISNTDGFYYKPRIDFKTLFKHKDGLIVTSSCMASKISNYVREGDYNTAEDVFKEFVLEFGEDFYGELQFNEVEGQKEINDFIIHMCNKYDVKTIIGGDVHYLDPEDNELQDAVIRSKRASDDSPDWVISARKLYFHDANDYFVFNKELGWNYNEQLIIDSFNNSVEFSEKVNFDFETGVYHLPKINTEGLSSKEYIEKVTWEGLIQKINTERKYFPEKYSNEEIDKLALRIQDELDVFNELGINDYMLIVHDIIKWERENGLYVGTGRGSACGSAVGFALGITALNPLEFGLIFERFINKTRKSFPDIDWDSEQGARDRILEYLVEKYGRDSVVSVPTFSTYKPKSALQAMSRGLKKDTGLSSVLMKKISKLEGLEETKDLKLFFKNVREKTTDLEIIEWIDDNKQTIEFSNKLLGQITGIGTHAGGIVITPKPVYNYIPVTRSTNNLVSAFKEADGSSKDLSDLGILKLDVLGLKTLNIIKECVNEIKNNMGEDLSEKINNLDLKDENLLNYFGQGNNYGIFQMDRSKMFTDKIRIDSFNDIIAINAMNRPGPLEKYLNKYGYWKEIDKGLIEVSNDELEQIDKERYPFPFMRNVLSETMGCLLYQEQFMFLIADVTGMTFGEADSFRRAIAWTPDNPKYHTVKGYFDRLEEAMIEKGYTTQDVESFVKYCRDFMGYSFNKSHAAAYSYITFQTLFLKYYYPAYFFSAMINIAANIEEIQTIIADARFHEISILPPSVKESTYNTRATDLKTIRLGFGMIKGMGDSTIEDCNSFVGKELDEILKMKFRGINKTNFQNLLDIGSFDDFGIDRETIAILKDIYTDDKIEKWFTRKKQQLRLETLPKSLSTIFDPELCVKMALKAKEETTVSLFEEKEVIDAKPWNLLLKYLLSEFNFKELNAGQYDNETEMKQRELMGFTLVESKLIEMEPSLRIKGVLPLANFEDDKKQYYFLVEKIEKSLTKTGKTFLRLTLNDGIKAKCWRDIDLQENEVYYGRFKKDNFGFTLNDRDVYKA